MTAAKWPRALRSMGHRNYRLFITGHAVSAIGTWMQRVAQDWLVFDLTGSAVVLGITVALQFLPMLFFGLWGGALVDRWNRRKVIIVTQALSMVLALILAAVVLTGRTSVELVFVMSVALGFVTVFDNPARQAFIAEVTIPQDYVNAQALASMVHNVGRLVGPAVAGTMIAVVGVGWAFAVNALSFIPLLCGLALIRIDKPDDEARSQRSGSVLEGLIYVFSHSELRACMILVAVISLFGQNFRAVLPVLAKETFQGDAQTYGWLTSALGLGAIIGALITAATERVSGWWLLIAGLSFAIANALVAVSPWLWLAIMTVLLLGVTNIIFNTLSRTLMLLKTDQSMHGRVMAVHGLVFLGTTPIGMPLLGWVCDSWGAPAGMWVSSLTALVAAIAVWPVLRRTRLGGAR
ncbi:MFS transporter [Cryobacterium sp. N21]|uniref:MFS transporter n=1 Tax=Cryobacterium sp. N21 TaxID=2048289 RepID=UPI000CE566E9|nr:MFS transporter [Cryobacterium sp. N21]